MSQTLHNVIILGAGPAGYTAAIYAARAALNPILLQGLEPGGQLTTTTDVENYPGFLETIQGPFLMDQMEGQAKRMGAQLVRDSAKRIEKKKDNTFLVHGEEATYNTKSIILATGAQAKWLGLESETRLRGSGVSACATCDGFFYRGHDVLVVGGGNTALEEALFLTRFTKSVTIAHRRDAFRGEKILQRRVLENPKINVLWNKAVEEMLGDTLLDGVMLRDVKTQELSKHAVTGVFVAIGHAPVTAFIKDFVKCDKTGYALVGHDPHHATMTSTPGIFAAGDVCDSVYRQAVTAAGMGCMAALDVERFLASQTSLRL